MRHKTRGRPKSIVRPVKVLINGFPFERMEETKGGTK